MILTKGGARLASNDGASSPRSAALVFRQFNRRGLATARVGNRHPTQIDLDAERAFMITLAYECVHSLQDGQLDLITSDLPTDASFALQDAD